MNDANKETLSAAMDGQLSKEELRFLLRRFDHDASLQQVWMRYHVAGDSLRHHLPAVAGAGFASRVMAVVEGETTSHARPKRDWLRLSVGGAIAAGVAVAALMVAQPTAPDSGRMAPLAANGALSHGTVHAGPALASASSVGVSNPDVLAAVPPSLSPYSASSLSQRASVTLADPSDNPLFQRYSNQMYSIRGYKALNNQDGGYLLLIDAPQAKAATPRVR